MSKKLRHMTALAGVLIGVWLAGCEPQKTPGVSFMAWSPDGRFLASVYNRMIFIGEAHELGAVRAMQKLELAEDFLSWSADSREIAFASTAAGSWDIWILNVEKGEKRQITRHPAKECRPVWAPSGQGFYFVSWRTGQPDIWYWDLREKKEYSLTNDAFEETALSLSRSGGRLCYMLEDLEGRRSLYVYDLRRQQRIRLVEPSKSLREAVISYSGDDAACLDDDGIHLIQVRFEPTAPPNRVRLEDTLIAARAPKDQKQPRELSDLSWSPDDKAVAFLQSGRVMVSTLGFLGGTRPLTLSPGGDRLPVWSPRGGRIAYIAGAKGEHPVVAIADWDKGTREWLVGDAAGAVAAASYCLEVRSVNEAIRLLDQTVRHSPETGPARREAIELLADTYFKMDRRDKLVALHRDITSDFVALGLVYMLCYQDFDKARASFEQAHPGSVDAKYYLTVLKEYPVKTLRLFCSAELARRRGEYRKAADYLERFLQTAGGSPLAEGPAFELGALYWRQLNQPEKALAAYASALKNYPDSDQAFAAHQERVDILWKGLRRPADAVAEMNAVLRGRELPDERLESLQKIADIWTHSGNTTEATAADWKLIEELIRQDQAAEDQTPSQIAFRDRKRLGLFFATLGRAIAAGQFALAAETAGRLDEVKIRSDEVRPLGLPRTLGVFDAAGRHDDANALLKNSRLRPLTFVGFDPALPEWLAVLKYAPKDVLVEARLGSLPPWIAQRLRLLVEFLQTRPPGSETAALSAMLQMAAAASPEEVARIEGSLPPARPAKKGEFNHVVLARATAEYLLGNHYQTKGDTPRALDHYERMVKRLEEEPAMQELAAATTIFAKCRRLLAGEPAAVKRWLDIERRAQQTIWAVLELVAKPSVRSAEYAQFLAQYPGSALADDAYYRLATFGEERYRQEYFKKLLTSFPQSPLFQPAFEGMAEYFARIGNPWMAARLAEELVKRPEQAPNVAFLELQQGKICGRPLKRLDLAMPHLDVVLKQYPDSEEWAEAEQVAATLLCDARRWAEALKHLDELLKRRPDFEWALNGDALLKMAECKENLGRWSDAEWDYVKIILTHRDRLDVSTGKILAEKLAKFTNAAKRAIYDGHPEDFARILPVLPPEQKKELLELFPKLKESSAK